MQLEQAAERLAEDVFGGDPSRRQKKAVRRILEGIISEEIRDVRDVDFDLILSNYN